MNKYTFDTEVKSSSIWFGSVDHEDKGAITGLLRGYNIEVQKRDGKTGWLSCVYIHGELEDYYNDKYHHWYFEDMGFTPTGCFSFRGYGYESYDEEIGDYITPCDENGVEIRAV